MREFKRLTRWSLAVGLAIFVSHGQAASTPLPQAEVTSLSGDVVLRAADGTSHAVRPGGKIAGTDAVRTNGDARLELTYADQTVARLGGRTAFMAKEGTRNLRLEEGVILVQAPKKAKGVTIHAGAYAAAVSGSTVLLEYRPGVYKFVVLEGLGRLYRPGHFGDSVLVRPGQLVIGDPAQPVSDPVDFEIARFLKTCRFITEFPPLPNGKLLQVASEKQEQQKSRKQLIGTNLVIFGGGSVVSLMPPIQPEKPAPITAVAMAAPVSAPSHSADLGTVEELPPPSTGAKTSSPDKSDSP